MWWVPWRKGVGNPERCRKVIVCEGGRGAMSLEREFGGGVVFLERKSEWEYQVAQESRGAEMSQCPKAGEARVAGTGGSL